MPVFRMDVRSPQADPLGEAVARQIAEFTIPAPRVRTARVFLIDSDAPRQRVAEAARRLLADPIVEEAQLVERPPDDAGASRIEIHLKPGVMDPVAASTEMALRDMGLSVRQVRTGRAYLLDRRLEARELQHIAQRVLANGVIESVHFNALIPEQFEAGRTVEFALRHVALRDRTEEQLSRLSREAHLFLSLDEMRAIQEYFRGQDREPTDVELETLAQTWSEHCVHKTFKSAVEVQEQDLTGQIVSRRHYDNLIKETIFKSTMELTAGGADKSFCLSVFSDNAGVIAFDATDAVCFKVETHNHPSAIEPYGGSATGVGGVIRDVLGTGLAAKPVANTDVFCVAPPDTGAPPHGVIHPKRILQQVVAGVRDYGNRMGIPTVNGAVYFDPRYLGNPLVFCGCVGLIPRDKIAKETHAGDAIVVMGGRTGRDGIHGATFSSAELTDTHADEFSHAVQIGNAITEKKMADVILQARDLGLFRALTDCGAGGLSSAVGEMGQDTGALVDLDKVPLKYAGLRYDEIWISEAQERMVLAVPPEHVRALLDLAASEDVEATVIGRFGTDSARLILNHQGHEVASLSMDFLHHGIPKPLRKAVVLHKGRGETSQAGPFDSILQAHDHVRDRLLALLAHPTIASKHWIIRQYDHEVQGGSVIKPLTGPLQVGPADAAVIRPKLDSWAGVAIGCGMAPYVEDPYHMAVASIDEALRNVIAVGAEPGRIALLDNFCWPSVDDPVIMGTLVRAAEACYDAAKEFGTPFISGKDSLNNQFTNSETGQVIRIPPTLLISAIGVMRDVRKCITMDFKSPQNQVGFVRQLESPPELADLANTHRLMAAAIRRGLIVSCHDVSDGGLLVAAAEMCIASGIGLNLRYPEAQYFRQTPGGYVIEFRPDDLAELRVEFESLRLTLDVCGSLDPEPRLQIANFRATLCSIPIAELTSVWRGTLDW